MNFRFITNDSNARDVAISFVEADAAAASLSMAFRIYYQLRPLIPLAVRQKLQANRNLGESADWFIPSEFLKRISDCLRATKLPTIHPWPNGANIGLVLTHDVETADGMKNVIPIADQEEELGFRSSWNVVPYKYKIDRGIIRELKNRGFEIGIHGYNHDGKLYLSERAFRSRLPAINRALKEYSAVGFRSPMVHRNFDWLQSLNIEYDASYFDVDPYQAMPGGVGSIWPFIAGSLVELPYTLPQDHTLFVALQKNDTQIWKRKMQFLRRNQGMALFLTHPDYLVSDRYLNLYTSFLAELKNEGNYWHALPREVARWWRVRDASDVGESRRLPVSGERDPRILPAILTTRDDGSIAFRNAKESKLTFESADGE